MWDHLKGLTEVWVDEALSIFPEYIPVLYSEKDLT